MEELNFDYNISNCKNTDKITIHKITSDNFFENNNKTYDKDNNNDNNNDKNNKDKDSIILKP